jgi:hypothetical protein
MSGFQDNLSQTGFGTAIVILSMPVAETEAEAIGRNLNY